ncbi:hypothetical protein SLG_24210 [Sphingobium sp. SYK-6]|uniref:DOMON-like domain-containing protein n=1 Tax=Sphingobium sp. (strain NBRC 103272 / SYK-6) TaxID=627192 RepID=UPI00022773FC|nr:DOMON-like domain-containing protein [Sphingobium sp. SYK-6]BAK67096.1 hypothetical protein SLG_24210 [Sphingobium sp. SYK-6]
MSSILAERALQCHPATPCAAIVALGARIARTADFGWEISFIAAGDPSLVSLPPAAPPVHSDGLWKTTCFELFFARPGDAYAELNLSPSGAFAAYHFDHYRTGMTRIDLPAPEIAMSAGTERLVMTARLCEDCLPWDGTGRIGISAVIEERGGRLSYWALAHPPGKPDFHHRDCFALALPPLGSA